LEKIKISSAPMHYNFIEWVKTCPEEAVTRKVEVFLQISKDAKCTHLLHCTAH
jgi:hypothetical protein